MTTPIERYSLTRCNLDRTVHSSIVPSVTGSLLSLRPEQLACDPLSGMNVTISDEFGILANSSTTQYPPFLESEALKALQDSLTNSTLGFALAAWFTPALEIDAAEMYQMQPLITFGPQATGNTSEVIDGPGCPGYVLQIAQFQRKIHISYLDGDLGRSCRYLRVDNFNLLNWVGKMIHLALTFDSVYTNIYVNGIGRVLGARNVFDPTLKHWNMEESSIQLFSSYSSEYIFGGSIQQVDLFDKMLDASQVAELYSEGVQQVSQPPPIVVLAKPQLNGNFMRQDDIRTPLMLHLGSTNSTSTVIQLQVEVLSLPKHGTIVPMNSSMGEVTVGTLLPIENDESSVVIHYKLLSDEYFNQPNLNAYGDSLEKQPESFNFRILAYSPKNAELLAVSSTVTQNVNVLHVNHPPIRLAVPEQAILDLVDPSKAIVAGIGFDDDPRDLSMDRVRVDVWSEHGEVSLGSTLQSLADFDSCRNRTSWRCVDGPGRSMTFVALPDQVSLILRNLAYTNLSPGGDFDEIVIRVSDGAGGMCLDNSEHWQFLQSSSGYDEAKNRNLLYDSIRDDCFQMQARIHVPGYDTSKPDSKRSDNSSGGFFDFVSVPDLLFLGIFIVLVAVCSYSLRKCLSCMARGVAVEVDNDDSSRTDTAPPNLQV